ncbi:hypothetical protein [Pandoraea apista]|nr:hypothetical protein [Pandoraea apista]
MRCAAIVSAAFIGLLKRIADHPAIRIDELPPWGVASQLRDNTRIEPTR